MFNFLGTIAEYFLDLNRERTLEGLKAAAARGGKAGAGASSRRRTSPWRGRS
jgi:DNA invertase Pin-like site-specific DNA recombinase